MFKRRTRHGMAIWVATCLVVATCGFQQGATIGKHSGGSSSASDRSASCKSRAVSGMLGRGVKGADRSARLGKRPSNSSDDKYAKRYVELHHQVDDHGKEEASATTTERVCNVCNDGKVMWGLPCDDDEECRCNSFMRWLHMLVF